MRLRRDDNVLIIKGRDRGKSGRITKTLPRDDRVLVEGVNIVLRHAKGTPGVRQAGIIQKELPIQASNVMLMCTHCDTPTRVSSRVLTDGTKARVCVNCQEVIE